MWIQVTPDQLSKDEPKLSGGHSFELLTKKVTWPRYCKRCGHCDLKNDISRLVTRIGCGYESDDRFKKWVATWKHV